MSCDFAVWSPARRMSHEEAGSLYGRLCDGDDPVELGLKPSRAVRAFYEELTAKYPDIDHLPQDEVDESPWTNGIEVSDSFVLMNCRWSRGDSMRKYLLKLARKHRVAVFDPQAGELIQPG